MNNTNAVLIVIIGVFMLWLATSGRLNNVLPAWRTLIGTTGGAH
jgi:hypothetical protein